MRPSNRNVPVISRFPVTTSRPAPRLYSPQPEPAFCAGCGSLLSGSDVLDLPDGARVHVDGEWSCLRAYGKRWRAEATKALAVMGIMLPDDPGQL